jgi:hypothetical protein
MPRLAMPPRGSSPSTCSTLMRSCLPKEQTVVSRDPLLTMATRYDLAARERRQFVQTCSRQLARAPIVMAAVDLSNGWGPLAGRCG